jgi:hypothetical protein
LGLKAVHPAADTEDWMWKLYQEYERALRFDQPINLLQELGSQNQKFLCLDLALIETDSVEIVSQLTGTAIRKGGNEVDFNLETQGWQ